MKKELSIVKIGGKVLASPSDLSEFLTLFSDLPGNKILVHGGGRQATELEDRLGIASQMVGGRRVTHGPSLDVITMVYAGLVNKRIVAGLQSRQCNAVGLSGADGNAVRAAIRPVKETDFGFVGDVVDVNSKFVSHLINDGRVPVFCALTHDGNGQLLNTNADTIASEMAIGMSRDFNTTLYYCFEKKGVLADVADENSVVPHINREKYEELLRKNSIADGMLPKLENCFQALHSEVTRICIGHYSMLHPHQALYTSITL